MLALATLAPVARAEPPPVTGELVLRSPVPPYPPQALLMHMTGRVKLDITVKHGWITGVEAVRGPSMLASSAARFIRAFWKFRPGVTGTYRFAMDFKIAQHGATTSPYPDTRQENQTYILPGKK